jgi:hypothetical protein
LETPLEERWRRVLQRNSEQSGTFKMQVSEEMFRVANSFWRAPDDAELLEQNIELV